MNLDYRRRCVVDNDELSTLHASAFGGTHRSIDWCARLERHSLGWVGAYSDDDLVGFVNVVWDGGAYAVVLDTVVAPPHQRRGIGGRLVREAAEIAADAGCQWLHVDFESHLEPFYVGACGFGSTAAGLLRLR